MASVGIDYPGLPGPARPPQPGSGVAAAVVDLVAVAFGSFVVRGDYLVGGAVGRWPSCGGRARPSPASHP